MGGSSRDGSFRAARPAEPKPKPKSRPWGVFRKAILQDPDLANVNDKVLQIIHTLRKSPEDRSDDDIKLLYQWLMHQEKLSSLFTTMSEPSTKKLCKEMEFLHRESGDVVVNQGDKGNTCFILVSGLVSVYVRSTDEQRQYHRATRASLDGSNSRQLMENELITYGTKVVMFTAGATFGELCLIEPDSKRSATIVVDETAQVANFIVLSAAAYLRMTRSQTSDGSVADHIAFLQRSLLFRKWTKMQLMHLANSMKQIKVPAGQFLARKGAEVDSFFVVVQGEARESVSLTLHDASEARGGDTWGVQQGITVELTFLGKYDIAGEYLAAERKVVACPVDIRAVTEVTCLVLNRKLFSLHLMSREAPKHARSTLEIIRRIAQQRELWRDTRVDQALQYPTLRVPITRKLMRLSGNCCVSCGRTTHVAGDELCMELAAYRTEDEKQEAAKNKAAKQARARSQHRISVVATPRTLVHEHNVGKTDTAPAVVVQSGGEESGDDHGKRDARCHAHRLLRQQWEAAEQAGLHRPPQRPSTTSHPAASAAAANQGRRRTRTVGLRLVSVTHAQYVARCSNTPHAVVSLDEKVRRIRESWPYEWEPAGDAAAVAAPGSDARLLPHAERVRRHVAHVKMASPYSARE